MHKFRLWSGPWSCKPYLNTPVHKDWVTLDWVSEKPNRVQFPSCRCQQHASCLVVSLRGFYLMADGVYYHLSLLQRKVRFKFSPEFEDFAQTPCLCPRLAITIHLMAVLMCWEYFGQMATHNRYPIHNNPLLTFLQFSKPARRDLFPHQVLQLVRM